MKKLPIYEITVPFLANGIHGPKILPTGFRFLPLEDGDTYTSPNKEFILPRHFLEKSEEFFQKIEQKEDIDIELLDSLKPIMCRLVFKHRATGEIKMMGTALKQALCDNVPYFAKEYQFLSCDINTLVPDKDGNPVFINDCIEDAQGVQYAIIYNGLIVIKPLSDFNKVVIPNTSFSEFLLKCKRIGIIYIKDGENSISKAENWYNSLYSKLGDTLTDIMFNKIDVKETYDKAKDIGYALKTGVNTFINDLRDKRD